jgi:amino acid transporter
MAGTSSADKSQLQQQIGLGRALFQSIAFMGPGASIVFSLGLVIANAGVAAPLAMVVCLVAALCVASSVGQLARYIPAAGGFFSYTSAALGRQGGFAAGWLWVQFVFASSSFGAILFGVEGNDFCTTYLHANVPWWVISLAVLAFAAATAYRGVKLSTGVTMVLGIAEVAILLCVIIALIIHAGSANTGETFNLGKATTFGLFALGIVFSISLFIGFEGSTPLAEEIRNPRRNVPRAVIGSTLAIGLFYVLATYAAVVGWGPSKLGSYAAAANPWHDMSNRLGSWVAFFVALAILNSLFAFTQAVFNGGTRVLFAMGRAQALPEQLSRLHPTHRTPHVAVATTAGLSALATFGLGLWRGPFPALIMTVTFAAINFTIMYILGCASATAFYARYRRQEFSLLWHGLVPLIGSAVLVVALYKSVYPVPAYPASWGVWFEPAWIILGVAALAWRGRRLANQEFARAMQLADKQPQQPTAAVTD